MSSLKWIGNRLCVSYPKGPRRTGYSVKKSVTEFGEHNMYRVIYPDRTASKDYYNKTMAKEHCMNEYLQRKIPKVNNIDEA